MYWFKFWGPAQVEPESGEFFLGKTLSEAIQTARSAYADRLPFVFRVGHKTAVELGIIGW